MAYTASYVFVAVALVVIAGSVLLLLRYFLPLRSTPAFLLTPVFLALALPVSIILLVPIDLASSSSDEDEGRRGIVLPRVAILVGWKISYWLTFALTWLILPILGEYLDSGYRTPKDRLIYSLKSNAQYHLIVLACGVVGLVYVFWQNGFEGTSVKGLAMALAYCIGLVQAVLLLGHGLVAVPRRLILNANHHKKLRSLQLRAPGVHEKLERATDDLSELQSLANQLQRQKNGLSADYQEWIDELVTNAQTVQNVSSATSRNALSAAGVITDRYLAELGRRIIRARHKHVRFTQTWKFLVEEAVDTQAVIDAHASKRLEARPRLRSLSRVSALTPYTRFTLYAKIIPALRVGLGAILAVASVFVVWSEFVKFMAPQLSVVSLTVVHRESVSFAGQVISSLWILYMCTCVLASVDDVKVWGNRALVRRNTYPESACWYAGQVAKMTVPLTYNFLTFIPPTIHRKTVFFDFLGRLIILTPLGKGFDYFFPMLILLPAAATLFNLYGRVKSLLGFGIIDDEEGEDASFGPGGWVEGRDLIERELQGRSRLESATLLEEEPSLEAPQSRTSGGRALGTRVDGSATGRVHQRSTPQATHIDETGEDENVFSSFAHRLQNTVDAWERPEWLRDLGKRPRWMSGDDQGPTGNQQAGSEGFSRWFGGRSGEGRIQLS